MKKIRASFLAGAFLLSSLASCKTVISGHIDFVLEGGEFTDPDFQTSYLEGPAGTPIFVDIPDPVKEGYFFVGWREKDNNGAYREINKRLYSDGKSYYYYPYGTDTFYAYFEPLTTLTFELGDEVSEASTLVAPVLGSSYFSGNKLSGYASKSLPSTSYLPTADGSADHLNFQYWYTEYPLVSSVDENDQKHYQIDTTQEKGEYRFDTSFGTDSMCFPIDSDVTLYAAWTADPTITVYFNIDGIEPVSFQAKDSIAEELTSLMNEKLGIDFDTEADAYYYPSDTKEKRFAGFYLDTEYKSLFALDSPISDESFSLYLKWENQVDVTLDYDGGTYNGETSHTFSDIYYENDFLGSDLYDTYQPTKENASFLGYTLEGSSFSFDLDPLPGEDITLKAIYQDYPTLTLKYDFPDDYTGENASLTDGTIRAKAGDSLTSYLSAFESQITDTSLCFAGYYVLNASSDEVDFTPTSMPYDDTTYYLRLNYKKPISIETYYNPSSDYVALSDSGTYSGYFGTSIADDGTVTQDLLQESTFSGYTDAITVGDSTYLYDGTYYDSAFTNEVYFPLYGESSHSVISTLSLYRKMTKAITLSFYDYDTRTSLDKSLLVLPGHLLSEYDTALTSLLGSGYSETYSLIAEIDGSEVEIKTILPSVDTIIYLKTKASS